MIVSESRLTVDDKFIWVWIISGLAVEISTRSSYIFRGWIKIMFGNECVNNKLLSFVSVYSERELWHAVSSESFSIIDILTEIDEQ